MIVHLNQREIHDALIKYIGSQGYPIADKEVEVTFVAGRGKNGPSAQLAFESVKLDTAAKDTLPEPELLDPDDDQQAIVFELKDLDDD